MNKLIYGRNDFQKIVSIEPLDGQLEIFHLENNEIKSTIIDNSYWILSSRKEKEDWVKLKGNLHFKYGKQYKSISEYYYNKKRLKEKDTFTIGDLKENSLINKGLTYYKGLSPKDLPILTFDIESTSLKMDESAKVLLISNTYRNKDKVEIKLFAYDEYWSQGEMLEAWCQWVREKNPAIICGHNIYNYDLPYLQYIADKEGIQLELGMDKSPIKFNPYESKFRKDQTQDIHYRKAYIYGRELVDTMFLAIKYDIASKKYESYGLKKIIEQEGLIDANRTFYDASQIRYKYKDPKEWKLIKDYCKDDSNDALKLFDLMAPSLFYWTQIVPMSFQRVIESATGSQINSLMIRSYLQDGHSIPKADEIKEEFQGAISYGKPGIYSNCIKWDVSSLYPSIIRQYEIYPKHKDPNKNFLQIIEILTEERLKNKKLAKETGERFYTDIEQSQKIGINSAYGFMGTNGLNFNYLSGASEITKHGREILKQAIKWATGSEFEIQN
jgi:DNA polymerase elongation subunit (family B)